MGADGPIIEGCTELYNMYGERCALDIKYMVLINAVEARVEVKVLRRLGAADGGVVSTCVCSPRPAASVR
jgi:hypothetical protein